MSLADNNTDKTTPRKRGFLFRLLTNIAAMIAVGFLLVYGTLAWLDHWTEHGKVAIVPDVKGDSYSEAVARLEADGFDVVLSDSVYNRNSRPGVVVEQNPKLDTKVKPGRTIYLTINAISPKSVTIPAIADMSVRQARSILEGLGIENISEVRVSSEFLDLVLGARINGAPLTAGARVPVTSKVVLEVGDGFISAPDSADPPVEIPDEQLELL